MSTFPAANHISNAARTEGEVKADLEAMLAATKQIPGAAQVELSNTISGGSITPAGAGGIIVVDTESAAATDDLANIVQTNYPDGACLLLRNSNAARFVVLKHAATGAGQMFLGRNVDYVLDDTKKFILLQRRGTDWYEIYRAPARLEMPVVTKSATFTLAPEHHGCLILCTGAGMTVNVPAAATLGNGFTVALVNANTLDNSVTIDTTGVESIHNISTVRVLYQNQAILLVGDGSNFWSVGEIGKQRVGSASFGATVTISHKLSDYWEVGVLTGNVTTLDLGNEQVGGRVRIRFKQDGTGGRTVALPAGAKVVGSLASAANQASVLDITYCADQLRWEGFWTQIPT